MGRAIRSPAAAQSDGGEGAVGAAPRRRLAVRAEMGCLPRRRFQRRRRGHHPQPQPETTDSLLPRAVPAIQRIKPKRVVLDGEIVIFTGFGTDFDAMTLRIHPAASRVNMLAKEQPATYIAFDLLADGDKSLIDVPLRERRCRLEALLGRKPESINLSPVTRDREVALNWLKEYRGTGLDGIVAKRVDSIYHPGERAMIKVKEQRTADCVVGGFRWGNDGKRVGSLLLGVYRGKTLEYIGHTSGFDD